MRREKLKILLRGALLFFIITAICLHHHLNHIPLKIKSQCLEIVQELNCTTDSIDVSGRDVFIRGTVPNRNITGSLKSALSAIPGIRNLDINFTPDIDSLKLIRMKQLSEKALYFQKNSDNQTTSEIFLDSLARFLKAYPNIHLTIRGWTDAEGDSLYNQQLSERRADRVRNTLILLECDSTRLNAIGFGEQSQKLISMPDSLARRVDFIFKEKVP